MKRKTNIVTGAVTTLAVIGGLAGCGSGGTSATTTTRAPAATSAPATTKAKAKPKAPAMTVSQKNAIASAENYLSSQAFSREGLIKQLSSKYGEGFSKADAKYAVDHIKVNWNEQAAKAAKNYLSQEPFSRQGLIHQLESKYGEGFTHAQALYGVNKTGL
jgi:hypothetical protein